MAQFVEKPDAQTASGYISPGNYFWNSGMFMLRASVYPAELEQYRPDILASCRKAHEGCRRDMHFIRVGRYAFAACPEDSVDYAVMETTRHGGHGAAGWGLERFGSWSAL